MMSVEQIARDFITNLSDEAKVKSMLAPDAMASGGALPQPMPLMESMAVMKGLMDGFPDMKVDVRQVTVNGNQAAVKVQITGTNTGMLSLPLPGMMPIPATGMKVSVPDAYVVTVEGDMVTSMHVDSPMDGGIPAMLAQIGVKAPGMM